jgi:hypothetical protein
VVLVVLVVLEVEVLEANKQYNLDFQKKSFVNNYSLLVLVVVLVVEVDVEVVDVVEVVVVELVDVLVVVLVAKFILNFVYYYLRVNSS